MHNPLVMNTSSVHGILLAAGAGSRFGGGKLTHMLDGVAIGVRSARNLIAADLKVTAVVRLGNDELSRLLEAEGCVVSECARAEDGMGFSLAHAIGQTPDAAGWVVALADMPRIRAATIRLVMEQLVQGALIVAPSYHGERGHPVGLSGRLRNELLALTGDEGARHVVKRHLKDVVMIEVDDPGVLFDIDRREDIA